MFFLLSTYTAKTIKNQYDSRKKYENKKCNKKRDFRHVISVML